MGHFEPLPDSPVTIGTTLLATILFGVPTLVTAQDSVRLRFEPLYGERVHRVFQRHTRMTTSEPVGAGGVMRTRVRETAQLGGMSQLALRGPAGRLVVHLRLDSLRTLVRDDEGPWREYRLSGGDTAWIQLRMDERLRVLGRHAGGDRPGSAMLVQSLTAIPSLVLPREWVRPGDSWNSELVFPIGEPGDRAPNTTLSSQAAVLIDSVMPRARDTLAFLSVTGTFTPLPLTATDGTPLRVSGGLAGTVVWSTGWRAFVSATTRIRVQIGAVGDEGSEDATGARVMFERTIREQVRT